MDIKLKKAIENYKQNIKEFEETEFDKDQIDEIKKGIKNSIDVSAYADPKFSWSQMEQIRLGLEEGLDVSKYADSNFDSRQMYQISRGLSHNIDVSKYADPKFNWSQMLQIRWGLEDGIDVKEYADPKFHWSEMEEIKKEIEEKSKKGIYWHKITRRTPTEEEKEFYNYKNFDTIFEGLPAYEEEVLVTNGKSAWLDSFDEDENGIYLSGTGNEADDVLAWAEIKIPNFNSLAESGAGGKTT